MTRAPSSATFLRSPSTGITRRAYKGQRWLVVSQHDEDSPVDVLAFGDRPAAEHMVGRLHRFGGMVQFAEEAEVAS